MKEMFGNTRWVKASECKFYIMVPVMSAFLMCETYVNNIILRKKRFLSIMHVQSVDNLHQKY
jgi:hypothetical protein